MRAILTVCLSLLVSAVSAAELTLTNRLVVPNVSSTTGNITNLGVSNHFTITLGESLSFGYGYVGVFADYSHKLGSFAEIDPFLGVVIPMKKDVNLGLSATLVHTTKELLSVAGTIAISRSVTFGQEWTVTPQLSIMPQVAFHLPSGVYFEGNVAAEWRPVGSPDWKFTIEPAIVYDTGAYGADPGTSLHITTEARYRLTRQIDLELGLEAHRSNSGALNEAFTAGVVLRF